MAAKLRFLVVLELLIFGFVISASAQIIRRIGIERKLEGEQCTTHKVDEGVCTKQEDCDQAFLYSLPYDEHTNVCRHTAKYKVLCCQSFMDFCKQRKYQHIYYGEDAPPGSFAQLARIGDYVDNEITWKCSSSIISNQFLLTAAHCLSAQVAGMGCISETQCDQTIRVKKFLSHRDYKRGSNYHDIALVQLENVIDFKRHVLPICPYHSTNDLPLHINLTVAGWGETETILNSPTLRFTQLSTVPREECNTLYTPFIESLFKKKLRKGITNVIYCARGSYVKQHEAFTDACPGDSGGPLQAEDDNLPYLVGVISTGIGCGSATPGIYTRVGAYFGWINETIHDLTQFA
uniref:Peptidase S1 domain-containing protein n=1 Tax=Anopheles atroparvus TaxID=41427 RepID=A0AAG5D2D2_ANOAO